MKRLPPTIEELAGRRAARRIRESTAGQFDRYGPEAQTEMQDRSIARLGLVDSGLVLGEVNRAASAPDRSMLDRIARERERAMARYLQDRDGSRLEQTMNRLDQEQAAAETRERSDDIPADVAVRYVQDLPETWRKAEGGSGRQLLASALFDRIDVLGIQEATVHLTAHAVRHGLAAALPASSA